MRPGRETQHGPASHSEPPGTLSACSAAASAVPRHRAGPGPACMLKGARIGDDSGREEALNWQAGTTRRGELEPNKADAEQTCYLLT